jgi:hypothetical protein
MRVLITIFSVFHIAAAAYAQSPDPVTHPAWTELQSYEGVWLSDIKTRPDGSTLQFRLTLTPFDRHERIYELVIEMMPEDGENSVLWHGYKGWDPVNEQIYYFAASPLGRHSEGRVHLGESGNLATSYTGTDQIQGAVEIRDVFIRIDENHFNSTSYFYREGEWQPMLNDEWSRAAIVD